MNTGRFLILFSSALTGRAAGSEGGRSRRPTSPRRPPPRRTCRGRASPVTTSSKPARQVCNMYVVKGGRVAWS